MRIVAPDYYIQFKCIADQCRHSCCIGWEIDVDKDTLDYYRTIDGDFGEYLKNNIGFASDGTAHFMLDKAERCPFLNQKGLCEIICNLGEEALCQICDDHPRYRSFYSDRTEIGLGLCCEAAGKLILSQKEKMQLVCIEDGEELLYPEEEELIAVRQQIFDILQDRTRNIDKRVENMLDFCDISIPDKTLSQWADIYVSLECLDPARNVLLEQLKKADEANLVLPDCEDFSTAFEQLLCYFIYRHLADSLDDDMLWERVAFAAQSYYIIRSLCAVHYIKTGKLDVDDIVEIARIYSSEIEYSEDNMEILLEIFS